MKKFNIILCIIVCIAFGKLLGFAGEGAEPLDSVEELMVVTAQFGAEKPRDSVYKVKTVDSERLKDLSAFNLDELLRYQLGFQLQQNSVFGSSPTVRGISGENVKILVDGVPVIGRLNGIIDLNHLILDGVERVEIIEGPVSVYYGSDALAGVVNLITDRDSREGYRPGFSSRYDSQGELIAAPSLSWFNGDHSLKLGMGVKQFDGQQAEADSQWLERDQQWAQIGYGRHFNQWDFAYNARFFDEDLLQPGDASETEYQTRRASHQMSLNSDFKNTHRVEMIVSFADYRRDLIERKTDLTSLDRTGFEQWLARGSLSSRHLNRNWDYQLGFEANLDRGTGSRLAAGSQETDDVAVFAVFRYRVGDHLVVQPSVRASKHSSYSVPLTPALHLNYQRPRLGELRASLARGFRGPSIKQQYLDFTIALGPTVYHILGNEDLLAEEGQHLNLSHTGRLVLGRARFKLETELFYNDIENLISLGSLQPDPQNPGHFNRYYLNINQHKTHGGQMRLGMHVEAFHADLMWNHTQIYNQLADDGSVPDFNPRNDAQLELGWQRAQTRLNVLYRHNGAHTGYFLPPRSQTVHSEEIEAWQRLDVGVRHELFQDRLQLGVGARNLLDVETLDVIDTTLGSAHDSSQISPGRSWYADVRFKF